MTSHGTADAGDKVRDAARTARDSTVLHVLARIGFAASGLVQVLLGALAIQLGINHFADADQSGAMEQLGQLPGGFVLLWVSMIGLLSLAVWLLIEAALMRAGTPMKRWGRRLQNAGKAIAYAALALTALAVVQGHPSDASSSTRTLSGQILALPGGVVLLVLVGLVVIGIGVFLLIKGVRRRFLRDIDIPDLPAAGTTLTVLGVLGYAAKGFVLGVAGTLFVVAAVTVRPDEASGLYGAFESLSTVPSASRC
ncbi:hypothetical protein A0130_02160 [Leifsonia xyli]|uniref:DUF1206 domain-containing protein n=1 Tax=Leifsonia xyli TaxID=1575 RepID=UPI0007CE096C|nr:hypothetical protein A0130_02160 [Leifsonia xyli]